MVSADILSHTGKITGPQQPVEKIEVKVEKIEVEVEKIEVEVPTQPEEHKGDEAETLPAEPAVFEEPYTQEGEIKPAQPAGAKEAEPEKKASVFDIKQYSEDSFQYSEGEYSRTTAEDFEFGETGTCDYEPFQEFIFTDSALELPFDEEAESVQLDSKEMLFMNEFPSLCKMEPGKPAEPAAASKEPPQEQVQEEPQVSEEVAGGEAAEEPQVSEEVNEGGTVEEPQVSEEVVEGEAAEEPKLSEEVAEGEAAKEPQVSEEVAEGGAAEEPQVSEEVAEGGTAEEPQVSEEAPEQLMLDLKEEAAVREEKREIPVPKPIAEEVSKISEKAPPGYRIEKVTSSTSPVAAEFSIIKNRVARQVESTVITAVEEEVLGGGIISGKPEGKPEDTEGVPPEPIIYEEKEDKLPTAGEGESFSKAGEVAEGITEPGEVTEGPEEEEEEEEEEEVAVDKDITQPSEEAAEEDIPKGEEEAIEEDLAKPAVEEELKSSGEEGSIHDDMEEPEGRMLTGVEGEAAEDGELEHQEPEGAIESETTEEPQVVVEGEAAEEPQEVTEGEAAVEPQVSEEVTEGKAADEPQVSEEVTEGEAAEEPQVSEEVAEGEATKEPQVSEEVTEGESAEEPQVSEEVAEGEATKEPQVSEEVTEGESAEEPQVSEEVAEGEATKEPQVSDEVTEGESAEEPQVSEEVAEGEATKDPQVSEEVTEGESAEEPQVSEEVAEGEAAEKPQITEEVTEGELVEEPQITEEVTREDAVEEPAVSEEVAESEAAGEPQISEEVAEGAAAEEPQISEEVAEGAAAEEPQVSKEVTEGETAEEPEISAKVTEGETEEEVEIAPDITEDETMEEPEIFEEISEGETVEGPQVSEEVTEAEEPQITEEVTEGETTEEELAEVEPVEGPQITEEVTREQVVEEPIEYDEAPDEDIPHVEELPVDEPIQPKEKISIPPEEGQLVVKSVERLPEMTIIGRSSSDLKHQIMILQERMKRKSEEFVDLKNLVMQVSGRRPIGGSGGVQGEAPCTDISICPCPSSEPKFGAMKPVASSLSDLHYAIEALHSKCRMKDHMIATLLEELRLYSSDSEKFNKILQSVASAPSGPPKYDFDRGRMCDFLSRPEKLEAPPQQLPEDPPGPSSSGRGRDVLPCNRCGRQESYCDINDLTPKMKVICQCNQGSSSPQPCLRQSGQPSKPADGRCACPSDFKILRRVGHDSLLISWKIPPIDKITGYEIFVNGVLKLCVRSPTRNKALVTTLNLHEKLVIFLYTVTEMGRSSKPVIAVYQKPPGGEDTMYCHSQ